MENKGILYALSNPSWNGLLKCGTTNQIINKRVSGIQTGNPKNCEIVYMTDKLLYPYYYERILKKRLEKMRFNREFFEVENEEIKKIYEEFNIMNKILNCEELILMHMKNNDKIYYKKIMNKKINYGIKNEKIYIEEIKDDKKIKQTYSFNKRKKRSAFYVNI